MKALLAIVPVVVASMGSAQQAENPPALGAKVAPEFPASWIGHWTGEATLASGKGTSMRFRMELKVQPTEDPKRFSWTIVYDDGKSRQERPYELRVDDAAAGKYSIDEKNGIVLPTAFIDGVLYSAFDVGGVRLLSSDRMMGETLHTEIVTMNAEKIAKTGAEGEGQEQTPSVSVLPVVSVQKAQLKRTNR